MTLTWAAFKSRLRAEMDDAASPYTWSDDLLYTWLKDALADYSLYAPLEEQATLTDKSGASYALPDDCLRVDLVESPSGTYLSPGLGRPNVKIPTTYRVWRYRVNRTTLTLNKDTEQDVIITYKALHPAPSAANDDTFALTFRESDTELISLFIRAKAYEFQRSNQSSLDRFQLGSGDRQDNPLTPEVNHLMLDYERKIARRYGGGVITLYRA